MDNNYLSVCQQLELSGLLLLEKKWVANNLSWKR